MEDTNKEILDSTTETAVEETEATETTEVAEETTEATEEEDVDALKEKNKQLYARAKKAEEEAKKLKTSKPSSEVPKDLSTKDVLFLAKADIHEDDIEEVLEWSKFKKVPVSEAYKQLKGVLQSKTEERKSAQATNTGPARRGTSKVNDDTLLDRAGKGEMPDSDDDLARLVGARFKKSK